MPDARQELANGEWLINRALGDYPYEREGAALHLQLVQAKALIELTEAVQALVEKS